MKKKRTSSKYHRICQDLTDSLPLEKDVNNEEFSCLSTTDILKDVDLAYAQLAIGSTDMCFSSDYPESTSQREEQSTSETYPDETLSSATVPFKASSGSSHYSFSRLLKKWSKTRKSAELTTVSNHVLIGEIVNSLFIMDIWRINAGNRHFLFSPTRNTLHLDCCCDVHQQNLPPDDLKAYSIARVQLSGETFENFFFPKLPFPEQDTPSGDIWDPFTSSAEKYNILPKTFPFSSATGEEYKESIKNFRAFCFRRSLDLIKDFAVPDIKQGSKDLSRDMIRVNGHLIQGTDGYQTLYQIVAALLLRETFEEPYSQCIAAESNSKAKDTRSSSTSLGCHETSKNTWTTYTNEFCEAELQAIFLLHLASRTLAGGHCLETVLSIFGNESFGIIVPSSSEAKPLEFIIGRDSSTIAAILVSHTVFRIQEVSTNDTQSYLAKVKAHFVCDLNITETLSGEVLDCLCWLMSYHLNPSLNSQNSRESFSCPFISSRLEYWINSRVTAVDERYAKAANDTSILEELQNSIVTMIPYRIYITKDPIA